LLGVSGLAMATGQRCSQKRGTDAENDTGRTVGRTRRES